MKEYNLKIRRKLNDESMEITVEPNENLRGLIRQFAVMNGDKEERITESQEPFKRTKIKNVVLNASEWSTEFNLLFGVKVLKDGSQTYVFSNVGTANNTITRLQERLSTFVNLLVNLLADVELTSTVKVVENGDQ